MYLEELSVLNFRNLEKQTLKFKNTNVVLFGNNGQGKTNLLEAIYLLSTGKSFRTRLDRELVAWNNDLAKLTGKAGNLEIELIITETKKELSINKQAKHLTELIGSFIVVAFSPEDVEIVSGSPDKKRRFLDKLLSILDKKYLQELVNFNKILKRRNQTLFSIKTTGKGDLWLWDKQLAESAAYIWFNRKEQIEQINRVLKILSKKVTKTDLSLEYNQSLEGETVKEIIEKYLKKLEATHNVDINRSLTSLGPHRDDFKTISQVEQEGKIISKDLGVYGSRGEQKAAALTLKLVEIELIKKEKQENPVLILDEVLGELDQEHQELLLYQLKKQQAFITTASLSSVEKLLKDGFEKYKVENGKVTKV